MKTKSLAVLLALTASMTAFADTPLKMGDSTWRPPVAANTKGFLTCANKAHGNWNQGVCNVARKNLIAAKTPITFDTLRAEMSKVAAKDQADFDHKVEQERLKKFST